MLLTRFDCKNEYPADTYCSLGDVKVIQSPLGSYREAGAQPLSRFVYRFQINNIGRPHQMIVRYPDDKRRFMLIGDGTSYDLSTGVITGSAHPISGELREVKQLFWPRWKDCSVFFMTWGYGEPAAVAEIEIHELEEKLSILPIETRSGYRQLGIQYEDPCGTGASEGAISFDTWIDHVVSYAKNTGQTLLSYPICWYHGPLFPSALERGDVFSIVVAQDRKQYISWSDDPPDWPTNLLKRFDKEGLQFQGVLTLLRLSSLMKQMNIDLEAIKGGADTINNVLWNDQVQEGTMDWTTVYNTLNYPGLPSRPNPIGLEQDFDWAYGERSDHTFKENALYQPGSIFNPLHPVVQRAITNFVGEIAQKYGTYPSFKGIAITMWAPTMIWFGSIHSGYDDFTIGLFQKETGIVVPVDSNAPDRFSRRYQFLVFQCREAWIDWRCGKIRELLRSMRDALCKERADLQLTLNLWNEAFIPMAVGGGKPQHQFGARPSTHQLYREAGLDVEILAEEKNIRVDLEIDGGGRDRSPSNIEGASLENFFTFRDHDFLDDETLGAAKKQPRAGIFIFNAWHEAWGKHKWFSPEQGDTNLSEISQTYAQQTKNVLRINSEYTKDGFWWDSELRISAAFPPAPHFLEQYAHAVAEFDACRITRGGLFLDKAHGDTIRRFARAYRPLPDQPFATVGISTDPVALRTLIFEDKRFFYLVNRDYYPIEVRIAFSRPPQKLVDLAKEKSEAESATLSLDLNGYELRSFSLEESINIIDWEITIPDKIRQELTVKAKGAIAAIASLPQKGIFIPGMHDLAARMGSALDAAHFAWLRRALNSYIVTKALQQ